MHELEKLLEFVQPEDFLKIKAELYDRLAAAIQFVLLMSTPVLVFVRS